MSTFSLRVFGLVVVVVGSGGARGVRGDSCSLLPLDSVALSTLHALPGWSNVSSALADATTALENFVGTQVGVGVSMVVTYSTNVILTADVGAARPINAHAGWQPPDHNKTVWRIGSVTKVFTALMLLQMVDQGLVSLDTPLSTLLPTYTSAPKVTLRSVASQLGGLVREVPLPCRSDASDCNFSTSQLLPALNAQPVLWEPDRRPSYSNLGFSLLGRALENRLEHGETYETFVESSLRKLGMNSSGFDFSTAVLDNLAVGNFANVKPTRLGWAAPNGEMVTTAADMARFLTFLGGGDETVLSSHTMREWFLPRFLLPDGVSGYGIPWEIERVANEWLLTKSGNIDQFGSVVRYSPQSRVGVWLAVNTPGSVADDLATQISSPIYAALNNVLSQAAAAQAPPTNALSFAGVYAGYVQALLANMTITVALQKSGGGGGDTQQQLIATFEWGTGMSIATLLPPPPRSPSPSPSSSQSSSSPSPSPRSLDDHVVVLQMPNSLPTPCLLVTELAWDGEEFVLAPSNDSVAIPHLLPGVTFTRVSV